MTARIFLKLLLGTLGVLIAALAAVDVLASRVAESSYRETLERDLSSRSRILSALLAQAPADGPRLVERFARESGARVTVIAPDGRVLADSEADPARMENHGARPEVAQALRGTPGSSVRLSGTLGADYLYVAVPSRPGAVRLAVPLADVHARVNLIRRRMLASTALAFLPALVVAAFFSRAVSSKLGRIIEHAGHLARGNFRARIHDPGRDELGLLAGKLNETGEKLLTMFETMEREHQELEKLERVRKDFVINVSHELRTPLASIQGYTETLLNGALDDPANNVRFLNIIRQNAERLTNLAADLLTLSRVEMKTQKFQFASYYVNSLLADCVESVRPLAAKKSLRLVLEPAPGQCEVFCDSKAVHQTLGNLLDNAINYTPEGGVIHVGAMSLEPEAGGHEFVEFHVQDSGNGIPQDELPRLFERFYRVDKARSRELGGTGLGLAIVKHLVLAHGGAVGVTSRPGQGARFTFTLPVHDFGAAEPAPVQREATLS